MATLIKNKHSNRAKKVVTERAPIDPVTFAEFLRRKNAALKEKNPNAPIIYWTALAKAVKNGFIPVYEFGKNKFIDWEESKDYVFKTYSTYRTKEKQKATPKKR